MAEDNEVFIEDDAVVLEDTENSSSYQIDVLSYVTFSKS